MAPILDIRHELDNGELSSSHWVMVGVLALVTLFDGYYVFVAASVIPFVVRLWHLTPSQAGLMVSSGLIGFMLGSLFGGPLADRFGRKSVLLVGLFIAGLLSLATAASADSFTAFLAFRLGTGIGLGVLLPLAVTLVNETAPRKSTNRLVGCVMSGWSGGGILAALAAPTLGKTYGWQSMFWVAGAAAPLALICWALLRESPRFLLLKGRQMEARSVMSWLLATRKYEHTDFVISEDTHHSGSLSRLLLPRVRRATLVVWTCAACSLFTIYGLSSWLPQAMLHRGEALGSSFAFGALLQAAALVGGLGCGWAADHIDRRRFLMSIWVLSAVAIAGLGVSRAHITNVIFITVAGFCVMGAQPVLNNFTAALYETEVRSTGVGAQLGIGRLGGILGPYFAGLIQERFGGDGAMFFALAGAIAISVLSLALLRPHH
jgi:AAHS family 4-hydroxybenzoate transporter-like MFS transporter